MGKGPKDCFKKESVKYEALYENIPFERAAAWPLCVIEPDCVAVWTVARNEINNEEMKNGSNPFFKKRIKKIKLF